MSQGIDEQFLRELGFLPDGETDGEFGLHIWDVNQEVVELDDENNIQLVFGVPNQELFLEAYDSNCRSVCITQIPTPTDREAFVTLLTGLGAYREQLIDHVRRELAKRMPSVKVTRFTYLTVIDGASEVIVYGSGSDWMVQYPKATNDIQGYWRRWFADRTKAEQWASEIATEEYCGPMWKRWRVEQ
jgi:hypothetical protein